MKNTKPENQVDYIEFHATDIERTKSFYKAVFGWKFEDYGPDYTSFMDGRLAGGFTTEGPPSPKGPLVVIYSSNLEPLKDKIVSAGGTIVKEIFSFPGGRRFHFCDTNGNELAVWSDVGVS